MNYFSSFLRKSSSCLVLMMLYSTTSFAGDFVGLFCVDVDTVPPTRIFELATSSVTTNHYSLNGTHKSQSSVIGSLIGSASVVGNEVIMSVRTTSSQYSANSVSTYQFNLDLSTLRGTFWSLTSVANSYTPWTQKSGKAALVSCDAALSEFSSSCTGTFCDNDQDGYSFGDCNDNNPAINPAATEICGDGIDQNCDGVDTACSSNPDTTDQDQDGYDFGDCNDNDPNLHPGATEICGDGIDQNCDGVDEACSPDPGTDNDQDGYSFGDCNDNDPAINPGATEICEDGVDQDCDGVDSSCVTEPVDLDADKDGYFSNVDDCNDDDPSIHPGAEEICGDDIDQDCSGEDLICIVGSDSYTNNRNGTVTDSTTGLIWQQSDDDKTRIWQTAVDYCNALTHGGSTDWRLPSQSELESLIVTSRSPMIDPVFTGTNTSPDYWSSTTNGGDDRGAYSVSFDTGAVQYAGKTRDKYARCVR